jgi:cytoskeletal protein RodZ
MNEDIMRLGEIFRTKREEMHLSLKEVENATSIRQAYLQAIEEGRASQFLSPVYTLGFIKQYGTFLGFDPEQLLRDHPGAFKLRSEKHDFAYGIGTLEMRNSPTGGVRWKPNLLWGSLSLVIIIAAWYFAKFLGVI